MANKGEGTEVVEKVVMRPLADLVRNPKNPRKSDPQGLKDLCESIKAEPGIFQRTSDPVERQDGRAGYNSRERRSEAAVR